MSHEPQQPNDAIEYKVKVKADKIGPGQYEFSMPHWWGGDRQKLDFNKTKEGMLRTQIHWVKFRLQNTGGARLRFHPTPTEAFWIKRGSSEADCPKSASSEAGITPVYSSDDLLIVKNENMHIADYRFTLNFLERDDDGCNSATYVDYDPGWENRNSGLVQRSILSRQQAIGIAALGTAALGLAWLLRGGRGKDHGRDRGKRGD